MVFWYHALAALSGAAEDFKKEASPNVKPGIEPAVAQAGHFYHHNVVPAVGDAYHRVQTNVNPVAQKHLNNNVAPTLKVTMDNTVYHIQTNIAPSVYSTTTRIGEHIDKQIAPAVKSSIDFTLTQLRQRSGHNFEKIPQITLQTAEEVGGWVAENPGKTAIIITSGVVLLAPGLVSGPALGALGFGAKGVGAGSVAAGVQAGMGNVAAGSAFSILQGAGAGGASEVVVNGVLQGIYGIVVGSKIAKTVMKTT